MGAITGAMTYCGPPPLPAELWTSWNLDPRLLVGLAAAALLAGRDRYGATAVAVLFVAFVSPLCALSAALFSARVVHHVLLIAVAAPLLALAFPARRSGGVTPWLVAMTGMLWLWHLPPLYDLALADTRAYWAMQGSLLATSFLFWRAALSPAQPAPAALLGVLAGFIQMGLLGALLTFAPDPLYAAHALAPFDWGLAPIVDQQLGGLIMWVPACILFALWGAGAARRTWQAA